MDEDRSPHFVTMRLPVRMAVESRRVRLEQEGRVPATGQALMATVVAALFGVLSFASSTLADGAPPRPLGDADAEAGQTLYVRECSACHGERGDGAGPAAAFLQPRPRDFTKKIFKVRTTDSGMPPRTEDLLRTIERGFPGTAMPSFAFLAEEERRRIAARVLALAGLLHEPEPAMIPLPASPPPLTPESVARGKQLYRDAECFSCHGREGKGDGPTAATLKDVDDRPIPPRDLTGGVFRGGDDRLDLYVRILTGMDGSPMPSYASAIEPADCWALVDYMLSLRKPRVQKPPRGGRTGAALEIAARTGCRGCHVLGDGKGGAVGPDLRLSAQKLRSEWLDAFLRHPREPGSIYPGVHLSHAGHAPRRRRGSDPRRLHSAARQARTIGGAGPRRLELYAAEGRGGKNGFRLALRPLSCARRRRRRLRLSTGARSNRGVGAPRLRGVEEMARGAQEDRRQHPAASRRRHRQRTYVRLEDIRRIVPQQVRRRSLMV